MLIGIDETGIRTNIDEAEKGKQYYCPLCNGELIQKLGDIRKHHYAHKSGVENCDGWHYDTTEWHTNWQKLFPEECREVVKTAGNEKHRADVLIGNVVIEFQHSSLSPEEFEERNGFYTELGYIVIWVFDTIEQWGNTIAEDMFGTMEWSHCIRTFRDYRDATGPVRVYLQSSSDEIVSVKSVDQKAGIKCFVPGNKYTKSAFVSHMKSISRMRYGDDKAVDTVFLEYGNNGKYYLQGCPLKNTELFEPSDRPCFNCELYRGNTNDYSPAVVSQCGYRFRNKNKTIVRINSIERFKYSNQISMINYVDFEGYEQTSNFAEVGTPGRSLSEIWNSIACSFMRCVNTVTGYCVQINKSPDEQRKTYGSIKGTGVDKHTLRNYQEFKEIKYADSKQWVLVYYR